MDGTANLVAAAQQARVGRLIADSFIGVYGLGTGELLTEQSPLPAPRCRPATATAAMRSVEAQVLGLTASSCTTGFPQSWRASTEAAVQRLRRRRLPLPEAAPASAPGSQIQDAAAATIAAVERAEAGMTYNVVDDEPVSFGNYFGELAGLLGTPPRPRLPVWLARRLTPYATAIAVDARLRISNGRSAGTLDGSRPTRPTAKA